VNDGDAEYQLIGIDCGLEPSKTGLYGSPVHMPGILCQIRKDRGITLKELAYEIGIADTTLSMWERGIRNVHLDKLTVWAKALDVSLSFYVDRRIL